MPVESRDSTRNLGRKGREGEYIWDAGEGLRRPTNGSPLMVDTAALLQPATRGGIPPFYTSTLPPVDGDMPSSGCLFFGADGIRQPAARLTKTSPPMRARLG